MNATCCTALLALLTTLAACGDGAADLAPPAAAPAIRADAAAGPPPLFDEQGRAHLSPPGLVPANTAARTRPGLYASAEQLAWQEIVAGPYTVVLDMDSLKTPERALMLAATVRQQREERLAWFVRGGTPEAAAEVVNALADSGVADVFLVR
jgi:hypothetical protein